MGKTERGAWGASPNHRAPSRTRLESAIASIWQDVLGVERAGIHDDFFELGGDSMAAVHMLAAIDDVLLAPISFADLLAMPTIDALAAAVQQSRQQHGEAGAELTAGPLSGAAPCTFAQERLWFVDQLAGSTGAYNEPLGTRLRGPLDEEALDLSLQELVRRHAAFRTAFEVHGGRPVQVVGIDIDLELTRIDLSGHQDVEVELASRAEQLVSEPFDLERAPLVRACLFQVAEHDHVLQLVFHHSITDGWSHVVVLRELGELYQRHSAGQQASPQTMPDLQYADYARWQRDRMQGPVLDEAIAAWRERLADIPAALELPLDKPRPPVQSFRGATRRGHLGAARSKALRSFSGAHGMTPFTVLLAAFDVLLHRYSGQDTIVVGSATAGRDRPELEDIVGLFANTVVLRNDLSGDPSFDELLVGVRRVLLEAVAHQEAPFEHLVAAFGGERDLSRHPIFQVFVALRPHAALDLPGAEPFNTVLSTSRADVTLWVEEAPGGFELVWEYSTDLFQATTIERMERHFLHLLNAATADPATPITLLPLLDEPERDRLLQESAPVATDFPVACIHTLFEAQAARRPEASAVTFAGQTLSYGELNQRANRVAHRLRELGIGPESLVALFLERSFELVVAVLAVLKAGGAYVPLDPEYPAARLAFVLSDTDAPVLLTQRQLLGRLPDHNAQVLCLDVDDELFSGQSSANLESLTRPENLAYVIYTSGSTGQPKGVQVEHRQVARLFTATEQWYGFGASDTWVLAHSYAFDVSVWELWGALAHGGRIVVCPFWVVRTPEAFAALLAEQGVTVLSATPSLFSSVQDDLLQRADELQLRFVVFAGEALQPASLRPWFAHYGDHGPTLVNMYGITETTVHSTYRTMSAADCDRDSSPIGVPIPDLSLYLLDRAGAPVPTGVTGEIYVGGGGVTRGYLNRPELTAQRFLTDTVAPGPVYRSGDLARHLSSGEVEFLGRMDDQVKIRGFRIELGEIQAVLEDHPAVSESAVIPVKGPADDVRLAAHVVPAEEDAGPVRRIIQMQHDGRIDPGRVFELPDGTAVAQVNPAETEFLFDEIFVRSGYLKHGMEIPPDACVLDVGANIGMFALLVGRLAPRARILAFEPMPEVNHVLQQNAEVHGLRLTAFACALGAISGTADFTYFPHVTLLSGRYAEAGADAATVRQMLENTGELNDFNNVDELLADRLEQMTLQVAVRTVSEILREQAIEQVDLLKVDVEKAELDVLAGIEAADWPKIRQLVIEVHGGPPRARRVTEMLENAGFEVFAEEDERLHGSGLYNVFGRRDGVAGAPDPDAPPAMVTQVWRSPQRLRDDLRTHLAERVPGFMVPASITFIEELPLTTNGKLDRRALPAPEWERQRGSTFVAPRTATEIRIAEIWRDVLGSSERVGALDNFFHLGGHSLLAARIVARTRDAERVALSVRSLFEHPTLAGFASRVDAAPAAGSAGIDGAGAPSRAPAGGTEYPLSFQQQQILFFDQLSPDSVVYNSALAIRITGELDRARLRGALARVFMRHEVLRTRLVWDESSARQLVRSEAEPELELVDGSAVPSADRDAWLARLMVEHARRPFDLAERSPLRTTLFYLGASQHVVLFQPHHVAFDARAVEVLYQEVTEVYAALVAKRPPVLRELPLQYGDFALWQREQLQGEKLAVALDFWRTHLAGAPRVLDLATDHPRPPEQTFAGAIFTQQLGRDLAAVVQTRCHAEHVTPYMFMLAAFAVLLYRRTGQDDILFGGPMANRDQPEFENVIGFFANTIVVRVRLGGNPTYGELLQRVRDSVLESYEHQEIPLELVVAAMGSARDPAVSPLFQVNFRVRVGQPPTLALPGTTSTPVAVDLALARFDLALELHLNDNGLEAEFNFNTDLFDRATVARLTGDFEHLLGQVAANQSSRLLDYQLTDDQPAGSPSELSSRRSAGLRGRRQRGRLVDRED